LIAAPPLAATQEAENTLRSERGPAPTCLNPQYFHCFPYRPPAASGSMS